MEIMVCRPHTYERLSVLRICYVFPHSDAVGVVGHKPTAFGKYSTHGVPFTARLLRRIKISKRLMQFWSSLALSRSMHPCTVLEK
jgi:hypothetical protein